MFSLNVIPNTICCINIDTQYIIQTKFYYSLKQQVQYAFIPKQPPGYLSRRSMVFLANKKVLLTISDWQAEHSSSFILPPAAQPLNPLNPFLTQENSLVA